AGPLTPGSAVPSAAAASTSAAASAVAGSAAAKALGSAKPSAAVQQPHQQQQRRNYVDHHQRRTCPSYVDPPEDVPVTEREFAVPSGVVIRAKVWGKLQSSSGSSNSSDATGAGGGGVREWSKDEIAASRVLAVHGWLDNAGTWDLVAPRLAMLGAVVVCIDLAGHGLSDHRHPHGGYYLWDLIDDILGVVDLLGWPSFNIIGHSTGGHISAAFAGCYPSRVRAVCMVDSIGTCIQFTADEATEMAAFIARRRDVRALSPAEAKSKMRVFETVEAAVKVRTHGYTRVSRDAARLLCKRGLVPVTIEAPTDKTAAASTPAPVASIAPAKPESPRSPSDTTCKIDTTADAKTANGTTASPPTPTTVTGYQWVNDPSLTLWAYLHCPEDTLITFFKSITAPVFVMAGDRSELFCLEGKKWSRRLGAFRLLRKETLFGSHHLQVERESAEGVVLAIVDFLGWDSSAPMSFWAETKVAVKTDADGDETMGEVKTDENGTSADDGDTKDGGIGCFAGAKGFRMKQGAERQALSALIAEAKTREREKAARAAALQNSKCVPSATVKAMVERLRPHMLLPQLRRLRLQR
ncbi:hypothetical protein DFJ73DRAFT_306664, partial [Zopfochytrium polystomum]